MLNAPGRLVFALTTEDRSVAFAGGFMPGAYAGEGHSDGAAYIVELVMPNGSVQPLLNRTLNPRDVAADRGRQTFEVNLPLHAAGSKLVVRTDPGAFGDRSWDWTYLADLIIK